MEFQSLYSRKSCRFYSHYERWGKVSEGSDFDDDWKEEDEGRVNNCVNRHQSCVRMKC